MAHSFDSYGMDKAVMAGVLAEKLAKREMERRILELEDRLELALMDHDYSTKMKKKPEIITIKL